MGISNSSGTPISAAAAIFIRPATSSRNDCSSSVGVPQLKVLSLSNSDQTYEQSGTDAQPANKV